MLKEIAQASAAPEQGAIGQWSEDGGLTWCDGSKQELVSARAAGWTTRQLYTDPKAEIERLQAEIARLESAWQADAMRRKDDLIAAQECENDRLRAKNARLTDQRDAILLQARVWAGEAKTQQAITREIGEILGGIPSWGPIAAGVEAMRQQLALAKTQLEQRVPLYEAINRAARELSLIHI